MTEKAFAAQLQDRIQLEYDAGGYGLGWRLLYSPAVVLEGARVAFLGMNPGGRNPSVYHSEFAMEHGSAYALESWKGAPGQDDYQRQALALFERLGERPEAVLAGNLVPFRSPNWQALPNKKRALAFGKYIWKDILGQVNPQIVIGIDRNVFTVLRDVLGVRITERISVGWGNVHGERGDFVSGTLVYLPHFSRFKIMSRELSQPGLRRLLSTY